MQYNIGCFTLCTIEGVAKSDRGEFKIRPKTLQVFQYLIEHQTRIVTKTELLDAIWDDVVVQEQVLFQSVKELRDIFTEFTIIKTFPRKGYQWVAPVQKLEPVADVPLAEGELQLEIPDRKKNISAVGFKFFELFGRLSKHNQWSGLAVSLTAVVSILALVYFLSFSFTYSFLSSLLYSSSSLGFSEDHVQKQLTAGSRSQTNPAAMDVVVLPIINEMSDQDHQWVRLEGMDILINQLQQAADLQVFDLKVFSTADVLYSLERAGIYTQSMTAEDQIYHIRQTIGADVIIQSTLRGYPQDYQLHYSLISPHGLERGVEFAESIPLLMAALTKTIAARFGTGPVKIQSYKSDFSNEAFASGVEYYLKKEFALAEPYLLAAISTNPELLAARRFLAGVLAHRGQINEAMVYLEDNIERAKRQNNRREEVRAILMIGSWLANEGREVQAEPYLTRARTLAESYGDQLFIAYAYEELGNVKRRKGLFAEAESLLKTALDYQQGFLCPYGQTNVLVALGSNAFAQGREQDAEKYLQQALKIANENGVAVNRFWTLLAMAEMHRANNNLAQSERFALQAKSLAGQVHDDYLVNKVNYWFESQ